MKPQSKYSDLDYISAPIFVLEVNKDGLPVFAAFNSYARQMSGRPLSDYVGRTAEDVYNDDSGRAVYARHCDVVSNGVATTYQIDLQTDGISRTVRTTLRPEQDENGKVTRLFGTSKDMTSERHAHDAKVQFDTLSSEMEQFVALAAHDLRAPMRQMAALANILREELTDQDDSKLEVIDMMENISVKSMDLISDVLSHAQISNTEKTETVFSFPALCQDICDVIDPKGVHKFTTSSTTLETDRTTLQIALRNVVENSIKHGGRRCLDIDIAVQPGLPGMIDVTLIDNGNGFTDAGIKIMNGGQFKVDSGYGLFAVKRLISARDGTMVARNLPDGTGAVVRFSLPGTCIGQSNTFTPQPPNLAAQTG